MHCPHCTSATVREQTKKTVLGYRTFRCPNCKQMFNERTGTPFNVLEYPTDVVLLIVLWRLRYKLSLRDLAEMFLERVSCLPMKPFENGKRVLRHSWRSNYEPNDVDKQGDRGMWMRPL